MHDVGLCLREAWLLGRSYWQSEERWRARVMLAGLVALNLTLVGTTVLFTYWQGAFYNALEAKDWHGFLGSIIMVALHNQGRIHFGLCSGPADFRARHSI